MRHSLTHACLCAGLGLALTGCPGKGAPDGGSGDAGPAADIDIGTGGIGVFEPVSDGDTMELVRGCQGSQHVWISLRARHINTRPAIIQIVAERDRDGLNTAIPFQVRLTFDQPPGADYTELSGLALVIPVPEQALDEDMTIRARVSENSPGGLMVEAERHVRIAWGDEVCGMTIGDGGLVPRGDGGPIPEAPDAGALADGGG